jgi:hypothetical protein
MVVALKGLLSMGGKEMHKITQDGRKWGRVPRTHKCSNKRSQSWWLRSQGTSWRFAMAWVSLKGGTAVGRDRGGKGMKAPCLVHIMGVDRGWGPEKSKVKLEL